MPEEENPEQEALRQQQPQPAEAHHTEPYLSDWYTAQATSLEIALERARRNIDYWQSRSAWGSWFSKWAANRRLNSAMKRYNSINRSLEELRHHKRSGSPADFVRRKRSNILNLYHGDYGSFRDRRISRRLWGPSAKAFSLGVRRHKRP